MATRSYAIFCAATALVVLSGQHRALYRLLDAVAAPELAVATVTGLAGLAWYEVAYAVGTGVKSAHVFLAIPYLGVAAALVAAASVLAGERWTRRGAALHLGTALGLGGLALAVLVWRTVRGYDDTWRLAATAAFLATHAAWAAHFLLAWRSRRASPAGLAGG